MDTSDASQPRSDDDVPFGFEDGDTTADGDHLAALATASSWVGGSVHGVGIGETTDGHPCVVVFADARPVDLPDEVDGLPVRVEVSNQFDAAVPVEAGDHETDRESD